MNLLLRVVSISVVLLGVAALFVVAAPTVWGQTVRERPGVGLKYGLLGGNEIGVSLRDVDSADVQREKLPGTAGAVVDDVRTGGPAAKAGVRAGDVIVTFDGEKVRSARHLERLVDETPDGREVDATVVRNGEKVNLKLAPETAQPFSRLSRLGGLESFGVQPNRYAFSLPKLNSDTMFGRLLDGNRGHLGVGVQDLTDQLGDYFGTPDGALITAVDDGTPAKTAGLKAGDVITKINGQAVRSADELRRRLAQVSGEVTVTVMRDRKELTLKATLRDDTLLRTKRLVRRSA